MKGNIKATILDAPNKNWVMKEAPDKFIILPLGNLKASDEALFATREFLDKNQAAIASFLEELIRVNRQINANPKSVLEERKKLGLLKDLPAKLEEEILPFFEEAVQGGIFPNDGGVRKRGQERLGILRSLRRADRREPQGGGLLALRSAQGRAWQGEVKTGLECLAYELPCTSNAMLRSLAPLADAIARAELTERFFNHSLVS